MNCKCGAEFDEPINFSETWNVYINLDGDIEVSCHCFKCQRFYVSSFNFSDMRMIENSVEDKFKCN